MKTIINFSIIARCILMCLLLVALISCSEKKETGESSYAKTPSRHDTVRISENAHRLNDSIEVEMYELNFRNAEFSRRKVPMRTTKEILLESIHRYDYIALKTLLHDSSSYDQSSAACFHPGFYIKEENTSSGSIKESYLCLDCNNSDFYLDGNRYSIFNENRARRGFSKKARRNIRSLLSSIGVNATSPYSMHFDYVDDYIKYQIDAGRDSLEVIRDL